MACPATFAHLCLFILAKGVEEGAGDKSQDTNTHHTVRVRLKLLYAHILYIVCFMFCY